MLWRKFCRMGWTYTFGILA